MLRGKCRCILSLALVVIRRFSSEEGLVRLSDRLNSFGHCHEPLLSLLRWFDSVSTHFQVLYAQMGARSALLREFNDLSSRLELRCDGRLVELPG